MGHKNWGKGLDAHGSLVVFVLKVSISPSSTFTIISFKVSLRSSSTFSSFSSSNSTSSTAFYLAKVMTHQFVQLDTKCPNSWHLKHLWMPLGMGLGILWGGWLFSGAGVFCRVESGETVGLAKGLKLHLLIGWFGGEGLEISCLKGLAFLCCLTL